MAELAMPIVLVVVSCGAVGAAAVWRKQQRRLTGDTTRRIEARLVRIITDIERTLGRREKWGT
jgi:hypothetical protein